MALMNPTALLYALLIGALVLIHFRRRSRTTLRVSNLQLWQAASQARETQPILERPRASWLLAVQVLFLAAVILALTQPVVWVGSAQPRTVVLVMDCSASMNARERGGTRFDLARGKARALIDQLGGEDRVLLVEARSQPMMHEYAGSERAAAGRALEALRPTQAPSDINEAVLLALASVPKGEPAEVFVFSDGTRNALVPDKPLAGRVRYVQTGETDANLAVTRLAVRSNPLSAHDSALFAEVANLSSQPRECRLELRLEEAVLADQTVSLAPREQKAYVAALPAGREGIIRATIHATDDFGVDNQAYAVAGRLKFSALLVTEGNLFLEKGLQVNPQIIGSVARPEEWTAVSRERYDVVILDGFVPPVLPPANYLILRYGQPAPLLRGIREPVLLRPEHPVTSLVDLSNVVIEQAVSVEVPPSGVALMSGGGQPLIVASEAGAFRTVEIGFDVRASNLPLTPSFPVLLSNALQWLGPSSADEGGQVASGTPLRWRVPAGACGGKAVVVPPGSPAVEVSVRDGIVAYERTDTTGVYEVRCGAETLRTAVNLLNAGESNIRPVVPANDPAPRLSAPAQQVRTGTDLHIALLSVACLLWASEWLYSSRRRTRRPVRALPGT
jgi:Ca-activated chloride channel family protein